MTPPGDNGLVKCQCCVFNAWQHQSEGTKEKLPSNYSASRNFRKIFKLKSVCGLSPFKRPNIDF